MYLCPTSRLQQPICRSQCRYSPLTRSGIGGVSIENASDAVDTLVFTETMVRMAEGFVWANTNAFVAVYSGVDLLRVD